VDEAALAHLAGNEWPDGPRGSEDFVIELPADGGLVGALRLHVADEDGSAGIGFWIVTSHRGRGYATEAVVRVLGHAFGQLGLERVQASARSTNTASRRVLENAGLTLARVRPGLGDGEDICEYTIGRSEWMS
jgi:aminoglycoside 6'-N-acetyltransferase